MKAPPSASLTPRVRTTFFKGERLPPVWLLLLYPPVLVLTGIILIFPITSLLNALGYPPAPDNPSAYTLAMSLQTTMRMGENVIPVWIGTWIWCRFLGKSTLAGLGLSFRAHCIKEVGIGFLAGTGLTGAIFVIECLMGWIELEGFTWQMRPGPEAFAFLGCEALQMAAVAVTAIRNEQPCGPWVPHRSVGDSPS